MDEEILLAVEQIGGRLSRDCYCDLCCLVETAIPHLPGTFSMEALYAEAWAESGKEKDTLAKSLSRAAEDIWAYGDREALRQLFRRMPREKPAPKDLVRALAMSVWRKRKAQDRPPVRYQLLESLYPRRFGIRGESWDPACQLVVLLYSRDRAEVEQLVQALNRDQVPLQEAQERFLCGEDLYTHS